MAHPVVHFEVWGEDGKGIQGFYKKAFDWKMNVMPEMGYGMTEIKAGKGIEGGIFGSQPGQPPSGVTVYIETDKIDAHLKRIEKAGGKIVVPRTVLPGMVTFAQFADPAGNIVGLVESQMPPPAVQAAPKAKGAKKATAKKAAKKATKKAAKKASKKAKG